MKRTLACIALVVLLLGSAALALCQEDALKAKVVEIEKARLVGTLASTVEKYEGLVKASPEDASLRYLLGVSYLYIDFDKKDATFDKAYAEFTRAKGLDPKMKYVNYSIGYILWSRGEYDKAIEAYKAEIANDPKNGWNYYNLGQAYEGLKQWDKAMSQYIIAIDKDPKIARAYNNLGTIDMEWKGDYFKALDNFDKAVKLKPSVTLYRENYNKAVRKLQELKKSLDKGQTRLPPETVEKLRNMDLKEIEVGTEGT